MTTTGAAEMAPGVSADIVGPAAPSSTMVVAASMTGAGVSSAGEATSSSSAAAPVAKRIGRDS